MKSIIEEIFYGNKNHYEKIDYGEDYSKITSKYLKLCDTFCRGLTEEQKSMFNELTTLDLEGDVEAVRAHYIEGFKMGFLIAVECLSDYK